MRHFLRYRDDADRAAISAPQSFDALPRRSTAPTASGGPAAPPGGRRRSDAVTLGAAPRCRRMLTRRSRSARDIGRGDVAETERTRTPGERRPPSTITSTMTSTMTLRRYHKTSFQSNQATGLEPQIYF